MASAAADIAPAELDFERALKDLESIVEEMESGDMPLETLLKRFEEGTRLARHCQEKLASAELEMTRLEKSLGGELTLKSVNSNTETAG
ncbi:MAG TPA: exodeoxyribonuclease VII small subunit [Candidatus Limnocylindria bacterium]|jgi:exodeoxyribonuclease VII small subunit|nr:exodeoxyribonuclease VII small subunit [Candidatus Limnocylindria bacterium]